MPGAPSAAPATGRGPHRRGLLLVASHTLWFWLLLPPATAIAHGQVRPTAVAATGLGTFALLYLALVAVPVADLAVPPLLCHLGLVVFAALGVGLAGAYAGGPEGWLILLVYVATAGAVGLVQPIRGFAWVGGSAAAVLVIGVAHRVPAGDITGSALITVLAGTLTLAFARTARLVEELRSTQQELARRAVEQERLRFARDLHDLLGHTLSLVVVKAEVVRRLAPTDPGRAAAEAADIERIGRTALTEVREAVTGYRDHSFGRELDGARTALAGGGVTVTVRQPGRPLPVEADDAFGWVLREGVTNVLRHSRASRCTIEVHTDADGSVLTVDDDGVGGRIAPGNGLRGLTERLARAGGELDVTAGRGGGTRLTARIPTGANGSAPG
ncbi:sensor histidine kinase [Micromonospora rifamycinica]|uniref:Two-component system, NarL family, sensor histidine kinase DesK n=1 Tax=Micromonospora rifamycinica TaxID=291594 RepID=A0A1C5H1S2_9ACTN|nr:sensor histidine kinase [Micromonospora rifamycinica]SCG40019.1 two-component system, NarL family, sensor histidine kinase DesK [Micromonospora rifamycinica]